ncbi:MAG: UDP-N-acetylmuramate--L-alanine ligase [Actinomycetota bacterium]
MTLISGRVHFVGVGGAGMSAIAKVLLERGVEVSGSDLKRSRAAAVLDAMGAPIHIGHDASLVDGCRVVVVSSAIPRTNPEVLRAAELGIDIVTRGQALASLLADRAAVVVAGTHGKTTTTSMIVSILRAAGRDPTYLVGGGLNDAGTNARFGRDDLAVAESDESDGSFLLLAPQVAVVTNVEADHLDYWSSLEAIEDAFVRWLERTQQGGAVVVPRARIELAGPAASSGRRVISFGAGGDVSASDVTCDAEGCVFFIDFAGDRAQVHLAVPGSHNVDNALAAAGACLEVGIELDDVARGLTAYRGVERRFQWRGEACGVTVIDDYAHHPTEVRATLAAARPGPWRRIVAVFQPHRYSRTAAFSKDFGGCFDAADRVVVTDVYGAGEQPVPGVSGKLVADAVCTRLPGRAVAYLPHRDELLDYLVASARPGDALLTLGAGDVTSVGEELLARLEVQT